MNDFSKLVIFYFSGTGNAKQIAHWFSENAVGRNIESEIHDIAKTNKTNFPEIDAKSLVFIISPIHGFNFPKITLDFIRRFPKANNKIVLMNTRAGMKIGKLITPGLTGIAFILSSLILKIKGHTIVGQIPFDMPSNWISLHPALKEKTVKYLHEVNYNRVQKHAEKIFFSHRDFIAYRDLFQDILISPIALGYYFVGRFAIAKTFYASSACDNCNLCINQCPVRAIKTVKNRPYWTFKCESCMHCMNYCPKRAIETAHGFFVFVSVLSSSVFTFLSNRILQSFIQTEPINSIVSSAIFLFFIWIFYSMQHFLLRYKFFSRVVTFFSFTHYKFWGRYKSISDEQWKRN